MRVFVFLLILANLLFLAWVQGYFGTSPDSDALRVQQQLLAEQVSVVARDEPPAEVIKTEKIAKAEKKAADICVLISDLPVADAIRLENVLIEKLPAFKTERALSEAVTSYWVYMPSLATRQEAEKKTVELKKLRVPEFFVVQDAKSNRWVVSLGIFSSKEAATERLDELRRKGVKSAKVGERNSRLASATLEIRGSEAQAEVLRQSIAEVLPGSKPIPCKPVATPSQ